MRDQDKYRKRKLRAMHRNEDIVHEDSEPSADKRLRKGLTGTVHMLELPKLVKDFCGVSEQDSQLCIGTKENRISFGPIDEWTQRHSVTIDIYRCNQLFIIFNLIYMS